MKTLAEEKNSEVRPTKRQNMQEIIEMHRTKEFQNNEMKSKEHNARKRKWSYDEEVVIKVDGI